MPKVSVIIPTYNRAHFICDAIDSVLAQTFKDYEIIVVDDGSTDNTNETLKKYGDKLKYVYQENQGPPGAMNTGVRNSSGEYFLVLGNDDMLMPDILEREVAVLDKDPVLSFVCSGTYFVDEAGKIFKTSKDGRLREKTFKSLLQDNFVWHLTALVRRWMFDEVGQFDPEMITTQDYDLWLRLTTKYTFEYIDAPLAKFRHHPGNTSKRLDLWLKNHLMILDKKVIAERLSFCEKRLYRAMVYYRFGMFYARTQEYPKAAGSYWKAVLTHPFIGGYFWPPETDRMKFSLPYRFLKPYLMPLYYFGKMMTARPKQDPKS